MKEQRKNVELQQCLRECEDEVNDDNRIDERNMVVGRVVQYWNHECKTEDRNLGMKIGKGI
jgi:hypothetical protein